ncbi:DUF4363 family protein [Ornithinibacillus californiensis]|uniref:DUF4363 family protein n=1 Tax=Ornithinibacillus californiensis TaxID=161536 RepID=UPI00064DBB69|nr:DUF4363 family protein [Ornithinibacillus californiensis]
MNKKFFILFGFLLILTACNKPIAGEHFFNKIEDIEQVVKEEDWKSTDAYLNEFQSYYEKNIWKLQLLGDENEYEGLHESLERLIASINEQDTTQSLIELATIRAYLEEIYSM